MPPQEAVVAWLCLCNGGGWQTEEISALLGVSPQEVEKTREKAFCRLISSRRLEALIY